VCNNFLTFIEYFCLEYQQVNIHAMQIQQIKQSNKIIHTVNITNRKSKEHNVGEVDFTSKPTLFVVADPLGI
jgi:hypothetical protein